MGNLKILGQFLRSLALGWLTWLIPKKRGLFVFYPTFSRSAYAGNLAPVFEALCRDHPEIEALWLTPSPEVRERLAGRGLPVRHYGSYPLWPLLRAECILLDSFAQSLAFGRFRLAQLWHGTGFKNIGLANPGRMGLRRVLHSRHYAKYVFVLADSEEDRRRKMTSFATDNVFVTGSPRNDRFFAQDQRPPCPCLPAAGRLIAYCPTFRDDKRRSVFSERFWDRLAERLERMDAVFAVKRHPKDAALGVPDGSPRIVDVTGAVADVQDLLSAADVLVTDYSSISTDFALTGRPIVFFVYDFEDYAARSRSLYYDLETVLPGPFVRSEEELLDRLSDLSWSDDPDYRRRYRDFTARFHSHVDGDAATRTTERLLSLR